MNLSATNVKVIVQMHLYLYVKLFIFFLHSQKQVSSPALNCPPPPLAFELVDSKKGQFGLDGLGQGYQFLNSSENVDDQNTVQFLS